MAELHSIAGVSLAVIRDIPVAEKMRLAKIFPPLACGVPVVFSGRGEASDLLQRHKCGVSVEPEQPTKLAAAIAALADNRAWCDEMGRAGRTLVGAEFSWNSIIDRWLQQLSA
jgi:glycosyltransferase involved in cell wall biosynthesis